MMSKITGYLKTPVLLVAVFLIALMGIPREAVSKGGSDPSPTYGRSIAVKFRSDLIKTDDELVKELSARGIISSILDKSIGTGYVVEPFVTFEEGTAEAQLEKNLQEYPDNAERAPDDVELPDFSLIKRIRLKKSKLDAAINALEASSFFEYVEEEEIPRPMEMPDDTYYVLDRASSSTSPDSWALRRIGLNPTDDGNTDSGWDVTQGSEDVVVAVYGTGIDYYHPDLADNVWVNPGEDLGGDGVVWDESDLNGIDDDGNGYVDDLLGWNFMDNTNDVYDDGSSYSGHDTGVAGIIGAVGNNGIGSTGVNWNVKLMGMKRGSYSDVIQYATDNGADIVQFSWTGWSGVFKAIVDYAYANGTFVVFSSGNNGSESTVADINDSEHIIVVGATGTNDLKASFSEYGDRLDFVAPGVSVLDTLPTGVSGIGLLTNNPSHVVEKKPDGILGMAYLDIQNKVLKYGEKSGNEWSFEDIEVGSLVGFYPSLTYDDAGIPYIAYYDWENYALKYANKVGGAWNIETIVDTNDQGYHPSIVLDENGYPVIAYLDESADVLKVIRYDGASWNTELVAPTGGVDRSGSRVSMKIGTDNLLRIAYPKRDTMDMMFAYENEVDWTVEAVDTVGQMGYFADLELDSLNNPHIVYLDSDSYDTKYAYFDGTWHVETVLTSEYVGVSNNIMLDAEGYPHISSSTYNGVILTAEKTSVSWETETVTVPCSPGYKHSAVLDDSGRIWLVTTSTKEGLHEVRHATEWISEKIADWGNPYSFMSGTSAAAPMVSGTIALLMAEHPDWTFDQIYWVLANTTNDIYSAGHDKYSGWGRIDAKAALDVEAPLEDIVMPEAEITYPKEGDVVPLGVIDIEGTANDDNFAFYTIYYKASPTGNWAMIGSYKRSPVENGVLASFDTTGYQGTSLYFKLAVHDFYNTSSVEVHTATDDGEPPVISLGAFSAFNTDSPTFTGLAVDDTAVVSLVEYQVDGVTGEWRACTPDDGQFNGVTEDFTCNVSDPVFDGMHDIYFRATDSAGNVHSNAEAVHASFIVDTEPPTNNSVKINNGATHSGSNNVTITLVSEDETTGVDGMLMSENSNFDSASWVDYVETVQYSFSEEEGEKKIYAKFRDSVGNESDSVEDDIIVDLYFPSVRLDEAEEIYETKEIQFLGTADDTMSNISAVQYRLDAGKWIIAAPIDGAYDEDSEDFEILIDGVAEGERTLYVRSLDTAGHTTSPSEYIIRRFAVDTLPPEVSIPEKIGIISVISPTFRGHVADAVTNIESVEYSLNGAPWQPADPEDGEFDSPDEYYLIRLRNLRIGVYEIKVQATDAAGHVAGISIVRFEVTFGDVLRQTGIRIQLPQAIGAIVFLIGYSLWRFSKKQVSSLEN